ncbi:hypothetical protein BH11PLA2_BH11PLA2_25960 [soil metagenome]
MPTAMDSLRAMPVEDRVNVMFDLWDNLIDEGWQPEPDVELDAELDRRLANHEADPGNTRTWEQILERIRRPQ